MTLELHPTSRDVTLNARQRPLPIEPRLLTAPQAAAYIGYKSTGILRSIPVRPVTLVVANGSPRWDRCALDRWLDQLSSHATDAPALDDIEAEFAAWEARNAH